MNPEVVNQATEVNNTVENVANAQPAKRRRGISNELQAASRRTFTVKDVINDGSNTFITMINSVKVEYSTGKDDSKDFPNMAIPRLVIDISSTEANPQDRKYITKTIFPIPSNVDTCIGGDQEWRVNNMLRFMKHVLDVFYLKGTKQLTAEEESALDLDLYDIDDNGSYEYVEPTEVLKAYGKLFAAFAKLMNTGNNGKPVFADNNGKAVIFRTKLLTAVKSKNGWSLLDNGNLSFPQFVGEGIFEIYNPKDFKLSLNAVKESITITEVAKKEPINPMAPVGGGMPQVGAPMVNTGFGNLGGNNLPSSSAFDTGNDSGAAPLPF